MSRPLKIYMRGKKITHLQGVLQRMGYPMQDQKGIFGVDTRSAVKDIQKQRKLTVTGEVDEQLLQQIQQGHAPAADIGMSDKSEARTPGTDSVNQTRLDALIRLLQRKGVIETGELEAEMNKNRPTSLI
ncbi:MAG: peptidoglycan-binding domain-containing protein [Mariprofundus sp.]